MEPFSYGNVLFVAVEYWNFEATQLFTKGTAVVVKLKITLEKTFISRIAYQEFDHFVA